MVPTIGAESLTKELYMSKGATQSGGTAGRKRAKDSATAALLAPAPKSWRIKAEAFPYHNNAGVVHRTHTIKQKKVA